MTNSVRLMSSVFLLLFWTHPLYAQEGRVARATRVEEAPTIDGRIDDAVWELAEPIADFIQAEPLQGTPASEETVVRILYDERAVYIGVVLYDSEPDQILASDSRRDSGMGESDSFQIILDTYQDLQNGFVFGTNPSGIEFDGQVSNEGQGGGGGGGRDRQISVVGSGEGFNLNWDASWTVRTQVSEIGWTAEFEIPLRTLRYSESPQRWGLNFQRNIRRKRETAYWSPIERIYNLYRLSSAGQLEGLELETPRNFKVTPYVVGSAARDFTNPVETESDFGSDAGFDVKFGVTPTLNLDLTYNTDFAHVEVDEEIVNLTRFNVRFPEKRPFFLENAGLFAAGKNGVDLFFSRRIGIDEGGAPVPILGGGRLSGKAGEFNLGVLSMQTDDVFGIAPQNNFTVARLSRELPNRSNFGGILVSRDAMGNGSDPDDWNRTWGLDGRVGVGQYTDLQGFVAGTDTPGRSGGESAYNARLSYSRIGGSVNFEYTEVGDDFNPEVGFLSRRSYRAFSHSARKLIRFPDVPWLRELRPHYGIDTFWDLDGFMESQTIHLDSHVDFENGWFFSPAVDIELEGLQEPFEIAPGIIVPPGEYRHPEIDWRLDSDQSRSFSVASFWRVGGFFTGNQRTFGVSVATRRGSNLNASIRWDRSDVNLPEGDFVAHLIQGRLNYSFTPFISIQSLVQYNDRADVWSGNVRFGWLNTAGTGLFVVYNEARGLDDELRGLMDVGPLSRTFVIKFSRQFDVLR